MPDKNDPFGPLRLAPSSAFLVRGGRRSAGLIVARKRGNARVAKGSYRIHAEARGKESDMVKE